MSTSPRAVPRPRAGARRYASGIIQMTMIGYGTERSVLEDGTVDQADCREGVAALLGELGYPQIDAASSLTLAVPRARRTSKAKEIGARDIVVTNITREPLAEQSARRLRVNGDATPIAGLQEDWFGRALPAGRHRRIIGEKC